MQHQSNCKRSISKLGVYITQYLGDGDSKAYEMVAKSKPYQDEYKVVKVECINHVAKRLTSRLKRMSNQWVVVGKKKQGKKW